MQYTHQSHLKLYWYRDQHLLFCPLCARMNDHLPSSCVNASFVVYICCFCVCSAKMPFDFFHRWNASSMLNPRYGIRKDNEKWKVVRCYNCGIWTTFPRTVYFPFVVSVLLNSEMVLSFYNRLFVDCECNFQISSICSSKKLLKELFMESLKNKNCSVESESVNSHPITLKSFIGYRHDIQYFQNIHGFLMVQVDEIIKIG